MATVLDFRGAKVNIEEGVHHLYEDFVSRAAKDAEDRPFATMKDVFMAAACLGARVGQSSPLQEKRRDIFAAEVFDARTDVPVLGALAYKLESNVEVLYDGKKVLQLVEMWANSGIHLLNEELTNRAGLRRLDKLVDLVLDHEQEP